MTDSLPLAHIPLVYIATFQGGRRGQGGRGSRGRGVKGGRGGRGIKGGGGSRGEGGRGGGGLNSGQNLHQNAELKVLLVSDSQFYRHPAVSGWIGLLVGMVGCHWNMLVHSFRGGQGIIPMTRRGVEGGGGEGRVGGGGG